MVTVVLWAAARDSAGTSRVIVPAGSLDAVLAALVALHPAIANLVERSRIVVDGEVRADLTGDVADGSTVEVLPPFAGG